MSERKLENLISLLSALIELNKSGTKCYKEIDLVLGEILNDVGLKDNHEKYEEFNKTLVKLIPHDPVYLRVFHTTYLQRQMYNSIIDLINFDIFKKAEIYYKRGTGATTNAVALALFFGIPIIVPTKHQQKTLKDKFTNNFNVIFNAIITNLSDIENRLIHSAKYKILICMDGITDEQVDELLKQGFKVLHIKAVD